MWIPPENIDPMVLHAPARKSVRVFAAVRSDDGRFIARQEGKFNTMTFHSFLRKLLRHRRRDHRMVVILDNARWHHATLLKPWLRKHRDIFQLDFLPPYSPELKPIERVWKLTRKLCTHNRYFPSLEELIEVVFEQFGLWYKLNTVLQRLCAIT